MHIRNALCTKLQGNSACDTSMSLLMLWHSRAVCAGLQWRWRGQHGSSQSLPAPSVSEANCRCVLVLSRDFCLKLACNALPAAENSKRHAVMVLLCPMQECKQIRGLVCSLSKAWYACSRLQYVRPLWYIWLPVKFLLQFVDSSANCRITK